MQGLWLCSAMCKDMCVRVHACIHARTYVHMNVLLYGHTHVCRHHIVCICVCVVFAHVYMCAYVCACVCVCTHSHMQRQANIIPQSGHNPVIHSPRKCQISRANISHSRSPTYCVPLDTSPNTF